MTKKCTLENLDCANCAAKMEDQISKLPGVESVRVSFMQQSMRLEAADGEFDRVLEEAKRVIKKIEPDVKVLVG